ncbi:hypothetical protein [Collimonas silvisoli]|uniref:hypothetical protein n=1 Tax=Collimonas silvisoli TaxID=2825884 RepID=UPI001B8AB34B|nr:hypothetical protein [Collimonas silvisoli]
MSAVFHGEFLLAFQANNSGKQSLLDYLKLVFDRFVLAAHDKSALSGVAQADIRLPPRPMRGMIFAVK